MIPAGTATGAGGAGAAPPSRDLAILAYKAAPSQFDISSAQSYISLRDQAVRVRTLLDAMWRAGLFAMPDRARVLIVGAGYAGVNGAWWLTDVTRRIDVVLVDTASQPFAVQAGCSTRYLSLTQYDWPARHYDVHDYPDGLSPDHVVYDWLPQPIVVGPPISLGPRPSSAAHARTTTVTGVTDYLKTTGTQPANALAADWAAQFNTRLLTPSTLQWLPSTRFDTRSVVVKKGRLEVDLVDASGARTPEQFTYIFYAAGFGRDGGDVSRAGGGGGTQRTRGFWDNDTLATSGTAPPRRILISGGGDGALQDFIRVVVDPKLTTACEVLAEIVAQMQTALAPQRDALDASWAHVEAMIASAETQAEHAATWSKPGWPQVWTELHRAHRAAAATLAKAWGAELLAAIAHVVTRPLPCQELTLVYRDDVPSKTYALNRFLFTIFCEYFHYVSTPGANFFGERPTHVAKQGLPHVNILPHRGVDLATSQFDATTRVYSVNIHATRTGIPASPMTVDELLVRHGTLPPPALAVRSGLHSVRLELRRIKLPFVSLT